MKTVAIIQARMGATRLPGKVLKLLCGEPVLGHVVRRVKAASRLDAVVVATTVSAADDAIDAACPSLGAGCFRGSEQDVLSRYYGAAQLAGAEVIVRITADCPLYDPALLDRMLANFVQPDHTGAVPDCMSNVIERSFPRGLDTEIVTFATLERTHRDATQNFEREHVIPYIYQHPNLFRLRSYKEEPNLSGHRWTLDTPEDWQLIEAIYQELHRPGRLFTTQDVLNLLKKRPDLPKLNAHVEQKKLGQ
ncbi:MAG TPA: glycosyltransferase family protein [Candidatus Paceibacterota bacterium]|nr:glycosyltransferase family protein [Verrucomicrobiota bacterium]HSA09923.1 glycosyltransferase family protein [Candidatus Paceibacterota bacterium]